MERLGRLAGRLGIDIVRAAHIFARAHNAGTAVAGDVLVIDRTAAYWTQPRALAEALATSETGVVFFATRYVMEGGKLHNGFCRYGESILTRGRCQFGHERDDAYRALVPS